MQAGSHIPVANTHTHTIGSKKRGKQTTKLGEYRVCLYMVYGCCRDESRPRRVQNSPPFTSPCTGIRHLCKAPFPTRPIRAQNRLFETRRGEGSQVPPPPGKGGSTTLKNTSPEARCEIRPPPQCQPPGTLARSGSSSGLEYVHSTASDSRHSVSDAGSLAGMGPPPRRGDLSNPPPPGGGGGEGGLGQHQPRGS